MMGTMTEERRHATRRQRRATSVLSVLESGQLVRVSAIDELLPDQASRRCCSQHVQPSRSPTPPPCAQAYTRRAMTSSAIETNSPAVMLGDGSQRTQFFPRSTKTIFEFFEFLACYSDNIETALTRSGGSFTSKWKYVY